jgi:UDP-N-acetylmuramyl pentapeptide phosphotransferase/UDP-N-acetylglucosamine-1-phosphate transferase
MSVHADLWPTFAWLAPTIVVVAAVLCGGLIIVSRPWLERYALARLSARSSHREPTPQGGGLAVIGATIATVALAVVSLPQFAQETIVPLATVLAATAFLAAVGAVDDVRTLRVSTRLPLQILAVAMVIATLPSDLRVLSALPFWLERVLLVVGGVWFVNIVNFMDGIDWITVVEAVSIAGGLVLIGVLGALPWHGLLAALALLGAVLGFAPFNRPAARLFLGDVGSLPIGLLLGWLLVLVAGNGHLAAAVLLPLYYLADATLTLLRRLLAREPVWQAHRSHFYQRATDGGFSVLEVDARIFAVNLGLVALAAATILASSPLVDLVTLLLGSGLVAWLLVIFARGKRSGSDKSAGGNKSAGGRKP